MKKILTSALVIYLSIGAAQAQADTTRHKGEKERHEMGHQKMALSADQHAKIKAINENFRTQMHSLKDQTGLTDTQRRERRQVLQQKHKAEIDAVLTAEQRALAKNMHKDKNHSRNGAFKKGWDGDKRNGHNKLDKGVEGRRGFDGKMAKELNLSTEQQAKIEAIRKENRSKLDAVRADATLTQEQKKAKAAEIMKAQREQMKSVLTPEQQQKMKENRKSRPVTTKTK